MCVCVCVYLRGFYNSKGNCLFLIACIRCSRSFKFIMRWSTTINISLRVGWVSECTEWEIFRQLQRAAKIHGNRKLKAMKKRANDHKPSSRRNMASDQQEIFWDFIHCVVLLSSSRCESRSWFLLFFFDVQKPNRSTKNVHVKSNLSDNECHKILKRLIESCKKIFFLMFGYAVVCRRFSKQSLSNITD